ncbi:TAP42-like protein [Schizophyllum amplum]|uniref:TAP42-like protein n=1 Tax=Schizophyllum amplum TaxID=97359 RepID=A0A550C3G0_9AGAR|nr:TAP42-like protein [Auriculariopsis ampla]
MTAAVAAGAPVRIEPLERVSPSILNRALSAASKAYDLPTAEDSTQDLIQSSLTDLKTINARVLELALFSPNETIEDITTSDLVYLFVPYVVAEVLGRVKTLDREDRMRLLQQAEFSLKTFISTLEHFDIVPKDERKMYERGIADKIKQYQKEKELKGRVEVLRKRRSQSATEDDASLNEFELVATLLPTSPDPSAEEDDTETDEVLPPRAPTDGSDSRSKQRDQDTMWRLDAPRGGPDGQGPLLDPSGKPLRPFTILPAGAADRARLQNQVFGPGHHLPSMTVDEYLQIEQERGNILSGGGKASESALTESEQLALDAEMDGSADAERREEEKRLKDENWANTRTRTLAGQATP